MGRDKRDGPPLESCLCIKKVDYSNGVKYESLVLVLLSSVVAGVAFIILIAIILHSKNDSVQSSNLLYLKKCLSQDPYK